MKKLALKKIYNVRRLVLIIAVVVAFALPTSYFFVSYRFQEGAIINESQIKAGIVSQHISKNPEYWMFEVERILEILERSEKADGIVEEEERVVVLDETKEQILV